MEQKDRLSREQEQAYLLKIIGISPREYCERLNALIDVNRVESQAEFRGNISMAVFSAIMFAITLLCSNVAFLDLRIWGFLAVMFFSMFVSFLTKAGNAWPKLKDRHSEHRAQDAIDATIGQRVREHLRMFADENLTSD